MPTLSNPLKNARRVRSGMLATLAIAAMTLLGGCSLWPKAWTRQSTPVAVPAQPAQTTTPAACQDCPDSTQPSASAIPQNAVAPQPLQPKSDVPSATATEPVKAAASPPVKAQPQTMPPAAVSPRTLAASDLARGFYINVGLFAVPANGSNAHQKLEGAGLPVFSDSLESRKGKLTRVRVGPFSTRAQADAAAKKILSLKLDAIVFRH